MSAKHPLRTVSSKVMDYKATDVGEENPAFEEDEERQSSGYSTKTDTTEYSRQEDQKPIVDDQQETQEREQWSRPIEFLLSCIAMSVGLGNIWRFPFTAYENGGGAFLIPYIIVLIVIGKPLYYMELCMGQFASYGSVKVWAIVPGFKGVGYGQALATWCVVTYYVSLMALTVFYFVASFFSPLPWASCNGAPNCYDRNTNLSTINISAVRPAAEIYYEDEVLKLHPGGLDDGIYPPDWKLTLCLLFSWVVLFLVLVRGVKSAGKSAYFTALFPYVVIFILLGRGTSLPGAGDGILFFITPQWEKLLTATVWFKAIGQCFFSLSVGFGSIIMFSSYNSFKHNIYRDAAIISAVDTLTSILAGLTIFAILGHLAHLIGVPVSEVVKGGGSGLAFISYPDVLARFDYVPQLFAVLFFLMLFTLGLGSASALTGCIITIICDKYTTIPKYIVTIGVCVLGFLLGLFYITPQGQYILDLIDFFGANFVIFILAFFEVAAVHWIYGMKNFIRDVEFMIGTKTGLYWRICWSIIIPFLLLYIFFSTVASQSEFKSGGYVFYGGSIAFGICLALVAVLCVPVFMGIIFFKSYKQKQSFALALKDTFTATDEWSPKDPEQKILYEDFIRKKKQMKTMETEDYIAVVTDTTYLTPWFHFQRMCIELKSFLKELYWND